MSAKSTGAYHIDVVRVQRSITLPTAIATLIAFAVAGILISKVGVFFSALLSAASGIVFNLVVLQLLNWLQKK